MYEDSLVGTISTILLKMISTRILDPIKTTCKISTRNGILDETHKISTSHCSITHESRRECTHAIICTWSSREFPYIHRISTSPHSDAHGRTHISTRTRTCIICNSWYTHLDFIITGVRLRDWHSSDSLEIGFYIHTFVWFVRGSVPFFKGWQQRVCQYENWISGKEHRNISRQD